MSLRKSREEIPIWWRSDSSSKGENSEKNKKEYPEPINNKTDNSYHAKTLKKWFPETEVKTYHNNPKKGRNERNSKKKSNNIEKLSKGLEETFSSKNSLTSKPLSSACSSRLSFVIPDNYNHSKNYGTESICTSLNNSSLSISSLSYSSDSSSSIEYSNFSSPPSSMFSLATISCSNPYSTSYSSCSSSSSSSCSSCISSSCSYSSTSYIDSSASSNLSSNFRPKKDINTKYKSEKATKEKKHNLGNDVIKTISSLKKATLTIQKLPEVNDIPLNPYFFNEQNNYLRLNDRSKDQNNRIMEEIRKFDYWENLEKAFLVNKELSLVNEKVLYSFEISSIDIETKEIIISDEIELKSIVPRATLNIKSGSESKKDTQTSKETFSSKGSKLNWGSNNSTGQIQKDFEKIHFSMQIYQTNDNCNYFSLTFEGVNLNEKNNSNYSLKKPSTILGSAFCPLPNKNDKWNISIPIYSCFTDGTFLDTKDSQLVSNIYPNVFKKLGKISFKLSREGTKSETKDGSKELLETNKISPKIENETTKEIRDEILSCLSSMNLIGNNINKEKNQNLKIKKSIVTGEVSQTIFSKNCKQLGESIKEKELELREREIQLKEKELELKMKSLTVQSLEQKTEFGNLKNLDQVHIKRETNKVPCQNNHSNYEKQIHYFRVKDKSRDTFNRIQLATNKKSGILTLGLKRNNERPRLIIKKKYNQKEGSKEYCKHKKKSKKKREKQKKNENSLMEDLIEQNIYSPAQIPLLVNNLPFSPHLYTNNLPQNYVLCYPSVSNINKENSLVQTQTQTQIQVPVVSLDGLKVSNRSGNIEEATNIRNDFKEIQRKIIPNNIGVSRNFASRGHKVNVDLLANSKQSVGRKTIGSSNNIIKKSSWKSINEGEEREIEEFLKSQWEIFSISCETILNGLGVCSNSFCKYRDNGRMEYSKCEYTNIEIDSWKICQYCQMEMFPSLYFINVKRPKFTEFFFDSSIPIFFPSRQLIWPTSLHFLLAQFFSNYSEVRECKTHDQIIRLVKKRQNSISIDILPNLAIIILAMKVFQHSVLQQLLLSFSEEDFFLLREYWIKYDPIIKLVSSDSRESLSDLGENLITTLEELKNYIQRYKN
ncbi:Uncharacterized protein cmbei_8005210 [Cryptosporidium meleagridis]